MPADGTQSIVHSIEAILVGVGTRNASAAIVRAVQEVQMQHPREPPDIAPQQTST
jgi:hypothetical protein